MAYNLKSFKDNYQPVWRNRFLIEIIPPGITPLKENSSMWVKTGQIPSLIMGTANAFYMGREFKFPGDPRTEAWNCTIYANYNANNVETYNHIAEWYDKCRGVETNVGYHDHSTVLGSIKITLLNAVDLAGSDGGIMTIELTDAFPINIAPIELDHEAENQVMMFNVMFDYSLPKFAAFATG